MGSCIFLRGNAAFPSTGWDKSLWWDEALLREDGGAACLSLVSDHGILLLLIGRGGKIFYIKKKGCGVG